MQDKKRQVTFLLIGLGCGMVLSGILSVLLLLNTAEYKNGIISNENYEVQNEVVSEKNEEKESLNLDKSVNNISVNENKTDSIQQEVVETQTDIEEVTSTVSQTVQVEIPSNLTASQTCELLEEYGIIDDAQEFRKYISERKMTTKLNEGTFMLEENMTYSELLEKLMVN